MCRFLRYRCAGCSIHLMHLTVPVVLSGTEQGMRDTFGSTCHGAGRSRSRNKLDYQEVLDALKTKGIAIRVASPKLVMEEAPESYKVHYSGLYTDTECPAAACAYPTLIELSRYACVQDARRISYSEYPSVIVL